LAQGGNCQEATAGLPCWPTPAPSNASSTYKGYSTICAPGTTVECCLKGWWGANPSPTPWPKSETVYTGGTTLQKKDLKTSSVTSISVGSAGTYSYTAPECADVQSTLLIPATYLAINPNPAQYTYNNIHGDKTNQNFGIAPPCSDQNCPAGEICINGACACSTQGQYKPFYSCANQTCVVNDACGVNSGGCTSAGQACGLTYTVKVSFFDDIDGDGIFDNSDKCFNAGEIDPGFEACGASSYAKFVADGIDGNNCPQQTYACQAPAQGNACGAVSINPPLGYSVTKWTATDNSGTRSNATATTDLLCATATQQQPPPQGSVPDQNQATSTRYDDLDAHIVKTGTWNPFSKPNAAYKDQYTRSSSTSPVASASISFTGTRLDIIAMKGTTTGIMDVYLDGTLETTIKTAATTAVYQQDLYTTGDLTQGTHTVKIVRNGTSASGKYITLDAVDIWGTIQ
jgi:hypothetical protein